MWYFKIILVPVLLPTLVVRSYCDNNDIIVKYSGHAEANYPESKTLKTSTMQEIVTKETSKIVHLPSTTTPSTTIELLPEETEDVVFVPNDSPVMRLEDHYDIVPSRIEDVMMKKTVNDIIERNIQVETEAPNDIVFITSKNNDYLETKENTRRSGRRKEKLEEVTSPPLKLDCSNLDCNNSINSLCGGKIINREMRYRLFLNECYLRKVNCNFKYEINRYTIVPLDKCEKIGAHYDEKPFSYKPKYIDERRESENLGIRRRFSSRRSMSMNVNGQFCSHVCPISCPNDYEPECAVSPTGQRKVFMNHCKLDDNSCLFGVVWHRRPLSECVGGKKADMRQNRYFIDWMRRVGIIDKKGKLVLE